MIRPMPPCESFAYIDFRRQLHLRDPLPRSRANVRHEATTSHVRFGKIPPTHTNPKIAGNVANLDPALLCDNNKTRSGRLT